MSEHDSDIEFDFFDEQETGESPPPPDRSRSQRPPDGPPPRRPSDRPGIPPTVRLVGLIAFGILIIVLLVLWVQSCSSTSKKSSYQSYLGKVAELAADSNRLGSSFAQSIATPGIKAGELANKIHDLAQQQQVDVKAASRLKAPAGLVAAQASLVEALRFRVAGLGGLANALRNGAGSTNVASTAVTLAVETERLVAGDVVWEDGFRQGTMSAMAQQNVTGLAVPSSHFLKDTGDDSQTFWTPVIERLNGNTASGGNTSGKAIGTELLGVTALPSNKQLDPNNLTTVTAGTSLGFVVTVKNSGAVQVASVQVTITIKQPPKPITSTVTIPLINPGETKTATFKNLPSVNFVTRTTLEVAVAAVKGETNPNNNSASYPVIFSLG
jgi:CARDB